MCDIGIDCDSELGLRTMYTYIYVYRQKCVTLALIYI